MSAKLPKLEPCPFCGKIPRLTDHSSNAASVACWNPRCKVQPTTFSLFLNVAIRNWNLRAKRRKEAKLKGGGKVVWRGLWNGKIDAASCLCMSGAGCAVNSCRPVEVREREGKGK